MDLWNVLTYPPQQSKNVNDLKMYPNSVKNRYRSQCLWTTISSHHDQIINFNQFQSIWILTSDITGRTVAPILSTWKVYGAGPSCQRAGLLLLGLPVTNPGPSATAQNSIGLVVQSIWTFARLMERYGG